MPDCKTIHGMQIQAFASLLEKYQDFNTNPGAEKLEIIVQRMQQDFTDYYFIQVNNKNIGVIRILRLKDNICRISPMFILPEHQGYGYAQQAIVLAELLYPQATSWTLDTIKQELKLCHLYEKMGYKPTGKEEDIQDGMTIIYYAK